MSISTTIPAQHAPKPPSLVAKFAARYSIDGSKLLPILKATAFRQDENKAEVTDEQMAALLVVADQYGLNPFTKEIYAFADRGKGIVPVVGVDGWSRIANDHPQFDGVDFKWSEAVLTPDKGQSCPEWCEAIIHRKDRTHPITVREYIDECYRPPFKDFRGPWQTHTKRMLRHKTLIQGFRLAFGFSGIYDEDEAARIIEGQVIEQAPEGGLAGLKKSIKKAEPHQADILADVAMCCDKAKSSTDASIAHLLLDDAADLARALTGKDGESAQAAIAEASKVVREKHPAKEG